jgi:polysaccharide biosynthesis protein PslH
VAAHPQTPLASATQIRSNACTMERKPATRLHVAILDEELPFPLNSGKRIRTYHLLSRLAERHRLSYLCHRNPDADEAGQAEAAMRELGIRAIVVDRCVPAKAGVGFYARLAANLLSPLPFSVATHRSSELLAAAAQLAQDDPPDLWHCEWSPYAEYLRQPLGRAPWVVMAHNVESLIWQRYAEAETQPLKRWFIKQQWRKFERFERWAYSTCATAIAVSQEDARRIRGRFGAKNAVVVDNGVDTAFFKPQALIPRNRRRILFLGSLDWRPNLDAVQILLDDIFPLVQAQEPKATLQIVGRKPPEWLRQAAAERAGVELHADVPDVRLFLASGGLLAVPLRIGGGSRLKILEALAAGMPVVSSQIGVEGLELKNAQHVAIADTPVHFSEQILRVMNDFPDALLQAERGRQWVLERYDWSGLADQLEDIWLESAHCSARSANLPPTCVV